MFTDFSVRRRSRCDQLQPCSTCTQRNEGQSCTYIHDRPLSKRISTMRAGSSSSPEGDKDDRPSSSQRKTLRSSGCSAAMRNPVIPKNQSSVEPFSAFEEIVDTHNIAILKPSPRADEGGQPTSAYHSSSVTWPNILNSQRDTLRPVSYTHLTLPTKRIV